jgi:predicted DNA-binding protein
MLLIPHKKQEHLVKKQPNPTQSNNNRNMDEWELEEEEEENEEIQPPVDFNWEHSDAKRLLVEDLMCGAITQKRDDSFMTIQEAFDFRVEYQATGRTMWARRLRDARKQLASSLKRAEDDSDAYFHDKGIYPPMPTNAISGGPRWDGSEAGKLLRQDVRNGVHEIMDDAEELYLSRDAYQSFEIGVFRKHVAHEIKRIKRLNDPNYKKKTSLLF